MGLRVLILGGTSEGRLLAEALHGDARFSALLSFAGRTESLQRPAVAHRVGGFGGAAGLAEFLRVGAYAALIDATHAFAARISRNAAEAALLTDLPVLRLVGPAWQREPGDLWLEVADMQAAAHALGPLPQRVLLTVGRLEIDAFCAAPQHDYLIRAVDDFVPPAALTQVRVLSARGPFALEEELSLLEREHIQCVVSKNAGTASTYAKLEAARLLRIPVVMVRRPETPAMPRVATRAAALSWLRQLHEASQRGE